MAGINGKKRQKGGAVYGICHHTGLAKQMDFYLQILFQDVLKGGQR
ncbi:MAG: hypothetical protein ACLRQA_08280 [Anaerovoracaceae bacterium]